MAAQDTFVDYYEVLEISPTAHPDTIARVYRLLAQRYHPDNRETGDEERFNQILAAHRVLGDPAIRASYDASYQQEKALRWKAFDAKEAAVGTQSDKEIRLGVLGILHSKRRRDPDRPAVPMHEIETLLGIPREHLEFAFWFLRERSFIARSDGGGLTITADGCEYLEDNGFQERLQNAAAGLPPGGRAAAPSK